MFIISLLFSFSALCFTTYFYSKWKKPFNVDKKAERMLLVSASFLLLFLLISFSLY